MFIDFAQPISLPPYWLNHPEVVRPVDRRQTDEPAALLGIPHACPLSVRGEGESQWWRLPVEPVLTVNGKNTIVKRSVLKVGGTKGERRGTVKELWSQDDYEVNISGIFINSSSDDNLPDADIRRLRGYCEARRPIEVMNDLLELFNIERIVIEDYSFPFTPGIANQMYTIKAASDNYNEHQLFVQ